MRTYEPGDVVHVSGGGLGVVSTFHANPAKRDWDYTLVSGYERHAGSSLRPATETELLVRWLETNGTQDTLRTVQRFLSTSDYTEITRAVKRGEA